LSTVATDGYEAVIRLAQEQPELLPLVVAAYELGAQGSGEFAGKWVLERAPAVAHNLRPLSSREIIAGSGEPTRGGRRRYYRLVDSAGVERALRQLGLLAAA
jgi:hypothetical protein